jgi:hypothetical protein
MTVDTGPGRGCRVTVIFPLGKSKPPMRLDDPGSEPKNSKIARSASN